jgi:hypothetical protein
LRHRAVRDPFGDAALSHAEVVLQIERLDLEVFDREITGATSGTNA